MFCQETDDITNIVTLTLTTIYLINPAFPKKRQPSNENIKSDILILLSQGINLAARDPVAAPPQNRHHTKADKWWS